jgi:hypothetical protein
LVAADRPRQVHLRLNIPSRSFELVCGGLAHLLASFCAYGDTTGGTWAGRDDVMVRIVGESILPPPGINASIPADAVVAIPFGADVHWTPLLVIAGDIEIS